MSALRGVAHNTVSGFKKRDLLGVTGTPHQQKRYRSELLKLLSSTPNLVAVPRQ